MIEKIKGHLSLGILLVMFLTLLTSFIGVEYTYATTNNVSTNVTKEVKTKDLKLGDKFALKSGEEATYLGQLPGGKHGYSAVLGPVRYIPGTQTKIDAGWYRDGNLWITKTNTFTATVASDRHVTITKDGETLEWTPNVYVDNKLVNPIGSATLLPVDPINPNYQGNTLEWAYVGFVLHFRVIEGVFQEWVVLPRNPKGDVQIKDDSKNKSKGFMWERSAEAWDSNGTPLTISSDKLVTAAELARIDITYPVTIDPTTTFTASASDGRIQKSGAASYTTQHDAATGTISDSSTSMGLGQVKDRYGPGEYEVVRVFLFFPSTSDLPDSATISSATLKLYGSQDNSDADFNIQIQDGQPTYPHDSLEVGDYLYTYYSGNGGTLSTAGFSTSGYNSISLSGTGLTWVSTTSATKLAILSDEDIGDSAPTGWEQVTIYTYEQGDGFWPQLEVVYTATDAPTITQSAVTDISTTTGTAHGYVANDGGEEVQITFYWDTDSGAPYANSNTLGTNYTTGQSPSYIIPDLDIDTLYYVQVNALNSAGNDDATEVSFTTQSSLNPPTNFRAIPRSSTSVSFVWTLGAGSSRTLVRYKTGDYPSSTTDGTVGANITGGSFLLEDLTPGQTIYVRAWGYDTGSFSSSSTDEIVTTFAGLADVKVGTTSIPSDFFGPADFTGLSNLPFYTSFNNAFDNSEIVRLTGWQTLLFGVAVIVGFAVFMFTKVPMAALVALLFVLAYGTAVSPPLIPGVYYALVVVIVLGSGYAVQKSGG